MMVGCIYLFVCLQMMMVNLCLGLTWEEISMFKSRTFVNKNTGIQGIVNIKENNDGNLVITSNGIPDHPTGKFDGSRNTPNYIEEDVKEYVIPKNPKFRSNGETGCLPMGPIGVAINGISIYNPYTITCCDAGQAELNLFDECWGHPSPQNSYHYHTAPLCLMKNYCNKPSSIIGVAFDGFPIYGPYDEYGNEVSSKDLDECNGRMTSDGEYRYHVTGDFPYFMNCYKGEIISQTGLRSNCECTKPTIPCEEFDHHDVDEHASNKSINEQLGLQKDGHFYCCSENDENCPFVTNSNTGVETATDIITNTGDGYVQGGDRGGQQGRGPPSGGQQGRGPSSGGQQGRGPSSGGQQGRGPGPNGNNQGQQGHHGRGPPPGSHNMDNNNKPHGRRPPPGSNMNNGQQHGRGPPRGMGNNNNGQYGRGNLMIPFYTLLQRLQNLFGFGRYNPARP